MKVNERLPRHNRLLYASAAIGGNVISRSADLWLLYFYAPPEDADIPRRASTLAVAAVLFAVRLVEAFDDPLIGHWSDRTRSRWGRRVPFVLAATPFLSLFFFLLWLPPTEGESARNALYLLAALWAFHLFSTLSGGPFESLLPEIAPNADDRLSIVSWQVAFGVVGAILGLVATGLIIDAFGFPVMAACMAAIGLGSRYLGLAGAWRRATASADRPLAPPPPFRQSVSACLHNDQFLFFLPSFILYNMGVQMMTGVLPFLVKEVLEKEEEGAMVAMMNGLAILGLAIALPFIVRMAGVHGKGWVYGRGMLFASLYFPLFFLVALVPGIPADAQALGYAVLVGLPLAPAQTFPNALIADITDYDTLRSGVRREATYYATQATFEKTASSLAPLLLAALLVLGSTAENPIGIRLVGPVAGISTFAGYLVFRRYWLPDVVTRETVEAARPAPKRGLASGGSEQLR